MTSRRLDLKLTFQCNNRCLFCVQGDKRDHEPDRGHDQARTEIAERRRDCDGIVFTGGEVTLRPDLLELIAYARELGYRTIQVQSNGRRMSYLPYLDALIDAGANEIAPAIHGATAATHDSLTRARGSFVQTVKGVEHARRRGARIILNSVIVRQNMRELVSMVRLFGRLGVSQSQFAFVHALGTAAQHFDEVVARYSDLIEELHAALLLGERLGMRMMTEAVPYCLMRGLERFVAEQYIPSTAILDGSNTIDRYEDYRWSEGKLHGPPCQRCTFAEVCEGPWREYPERFGWEEFEPRSDPPPGGATSSTGL
jgi:MoaA/NifB/PqqE/SkfB family radical SAM enzyme